MPKFYLELWFKMIFCAVRKEGYGQGDLYISFKNESGTWSEAKNMGGQINN